MPYPHKKHVVLSTDMDHLRMKINESKRKQKLSREIIYNRGKLVQYFVESLQKIVSLLNLLMKAAEQISTVGFVFKLLAVLPNALTTLVDNKSSRFKKTVASAILFTTTGLLILAFVFGGVVASGIGLALISLATLIAGISFIASLTYKHRMSKAYVEKRQFIDLLNKRESHALEKGVYRERLEIRALELEYLIKNSSSVSPKILEELEFINQIRTKHKYESPQVTHWFFLFFNALRSKIGLSEVLPKKNPVAQLKSLYEKRRELVLSLADLTRLINEKKDQACNPLLIEQVRTLQRQIAETDTDIESITEPLDQLEHSSLLADETIAKSFINLTLGGVGVVLSTLALLLLLGVLVSPPIVGVIIAAFNIGLFVIGAIKWGVDIYLNRQDEKIMKERTEEHEELILEEALHSSSSDLSQTKSCSYSSPLLPILSSKKTSDPEIPKNNINGIPIEKSAPKPLPASESRSPISEGSTPSCC